MFKVSCKVVKAVQVGNEFKIRGIASDTAIDRDEEKFAPEAVKKMRDRIKEKGVPLRAEHQGFWFTKIGQVVDANINAKGQLVIDAVVSQDRMLGKEFIQICKEAQEGKEEMPGFSVGGYVLEATSEFIASLGKSIKVYKDFIINEVSLVANPSNYNVTLEVPLVKSVNWEKLENEGILEQTNIMDTIHKGLFLDEFIENITQREVSDILWSAWCTLEDIIKEDEKSAEEKMLAIDEFGATIKDLLAEKLATLETLENQEEMQEQVVYEDGGDMVSKFVDATKISLVKQVKDGSAELKLPMFLKEYILVTKTEDPEEAELASKEEEPVEEASEEVDAVEQVEEQEVVEVEKSHTQTYIESIMSEYTNTSVSSNSSIALESITKTVTDILNDVDGLLERDVEKRCKGNKSVKKIQKSLSVILPLVSKATVVVDFNAAMKAANPEYSSDSFNSSIAGVVAFLGACAKKEVEALRNEIVEIYGEKEETKKSTIADIKAEVNIDDLLSDTLHKEEIEQVESIADSNDAQKEVVVEAPATTSEVSKSTNTQDISHDIALTLKSFTQRAEKFDAITKAVNDRFSKQDETINKLVQIVDTIANMPMARKSVTTSAVVLEKSSGSDTPKTYEELLKHNMNKADFAEAYKSAKEGIVL